MKSVRRFASSSAICVAQHCARSTSACERPAVQLLTSRMPSYAETQRSALSAMCAAQGRREQTCLSLRVEMRGVRRSASSSAMSVAQRRAVSTRLCERPALKRLTTREATSCRETKAQPAFSSTRLDATRSGTCSKGT